MPLTTVAQPFDQIGAQAVARLLRRIADPSLAPQTLMLPAHLLPGVTTATATLDSVIGVANG